MDDASSAQHEFAALLSQLRDRRGLTQENVSRQLGISRSALARWERGYSLPSRQHIQQLEELFGDSRLEEIWLAAREAMYPVRELDRALWRLESDESSLSASRQFEELVFALLDAEARVQGRQGVQRHAPGSSLRFDGYLPEGLSELPGPLAVEVIFVRSNSVRDLHRVTFKVERLLFNAAQAGIVGVLVIHNQVLDERGNATLHDLATRFPSLRTTFWDRRTLDQLAAHHDETTRLSSDDLFLRTVERSARQAESWRERRQELLEDLRRTYRDEGVVFLLGAGVSQGSGLPGWGELVGGLFVAAFDQRLGGDLTPEAAVALSSAAATLNGESPLQTARYLRRALAAQNVSFEDKLAEVLYRKFNPGQPSKLLEAIAALCVPERTRPPVHSVITYNFDDLLEGRLRQHLVRHVSIYRDHTHAVPAELPIYHVHGFLPRDRAAFSQLEESLLAFSEEGYHQLYSDPYHWTNIVQLNSFREHTCVLLGLSLTDPNLRRLLELGSRGSTSPRHYVFMRRLSDRDLSRVNDLGQTVDKTMRREFLDVHHALYESILSELGVSVVWFDRFDEMPSALLSLRESR